VELYHGLHEGACTLQSIHEFDTPVLDSFWCYCSENEASNEPRQSKSKWLCVREKGLLTFIMGSGHVHTLPLPFMVCTYTCSNALSALFYIP